MGDEQTTNKTFFQRQKNKGGMSERVREKK
jgi:hypothetical protein